MARAKRRVPGFAFDYLEGGVGDEICMDRNRNALDSIEIIPRYGVDITTLATKRSLFGRDYSMPLGIAPMGLAGLVWPDADALMAAAAEKAGIPFVLSMVSNIDVEAAARVAPNSVWLQLYAVPKDDYAVVFDMVDRAERAGVNALVLTLDTPMRQKRLRDLSNGLTVPFKPTLKTVYQVATSPFWALETLLKGQPRFANFLPYVEGRRRPADVATYVNDYMVGPTTWELIARVREKWKKPLILKGAQHVGDALQSVDMGVDGLIISNHGGRQFDAAPAAIDVLQEFKTRLGSRVPVMLDGSVYTGLDVMKAMICGADFVFAGRPFLAAAAALGQRGPAHAIGMYMSELRGVMGQTGITDISHTQSVTYRMNRLEPFGERSA
jgi:L-lactate dehydrogenase (cytochrome)